MAGGSLTLNVSTYRQLEAAAQRVLCWVTDTFLVRISTSSAPNQSIVIPEEVFGAGALQLKRGGPNLVLGYVPGTHITFNAGNSASINQNANTCPSSVNQPTITTIVTNVGGDPRTITVNYSNAVGNGPVNFHWGDGTSTLGAAESGAENHTYAGFGSARFGIPIRIEDASNPADYAEFVVTR